MRSSLPWNEILENARHFRWNIESFEKSVKENEGYFFDFTILKDEIISFSHSEAVANLSKQDLFDKIFSQIYHLIKMPECDSTLFCDQHPLSEDVYEVCLFTTLCSFLHATKRIKGKSLREFVRYNHPLDFNNINSPNYRIPSLFSAEVDKLRKSRNRLLSTGAVYYKKSQWAAMPKDVEYEWMFYYALDNASEVVQDVFKRISNLYIGITKAFDADKDDGYKARLDDAYKKFLSKLGKIKYGDYLELQKVILARISENKEYYGLNIYRLEKRLKPYIITNEVKRLLTCQSADEANLLERSIILNNIHYPKLYEDFLPLPYPVMVSCAESFPGFLQDITCSSCLVIDELVEKGAFGDNWENLFLDTINEMAATVFYDPEEIDFAVAEGSQEKFERLLCAPVITALHEKSDEPFIWKKL